MNDEIDATAPVAGNNTPVTPVHSQNAVNPEDRQVTVAFCQQCGRGLTVDTLRTIGSGIFCDPCAMTKHTQAPGNTAPGATNEQAGPPFAPVSNAPGNGTSGNRFPNQLGSLPPAVSEPNPVLAGFLGLIPGVGAMYNGQYPKGVIHLIIFVVLTSLADNLNWVLWWFVWGWIFYQGFEAYHTALARRDGLPLPDPFGWNDLGDRLGFHRVSPNPGWPNTSAGTYAASQAASQAAASARARSSASAFAAAASAGTGYPSTSPFVSPAVPAAHAGRAGTDPNPPVVPPPAWSATPPQPFAEAQGSAGFTAVPDVPIADPFQPGPQDSGAGSTTGATQGSSQGSSQGSAQAAAPSGFGPTYTGAPVYGSTMPVAPPVVLSATGSQRFPAGAAWLIGLGALFLVANIAPGWRLEGRWLVPALLALVAVWTGIRRVETSNLFRTSSFSANPAAFAEALLGSILLFAVAVLLALQAARVVSLRHSWPALLIVWGALLLLSRARATLPDLTTATPGNGEPAGTSLPNEPLSR